MALPVDVAGEAIAVVAKRGAGKTTTGRVLAEELHAAGVPFTVLDPVGAWWGLRSSADGKGEGLPVPILGGPFGDVPLEHMAGGLLADVVVDTGSSLVLDLTDFSKTNQRRFVTDFAERLYQRKGRDRSLLHLILEETAEFAPQNVRAGDARMFGAIDSVVRLGRGRGLGVTMITQRTAALNKSVLEEADVLIALRTMGKRARDAIEAWIEHQELAEGDDPKGFIRSLPGLKDGEAWVWNPERAIFARVQIRRGRTFDSGKGGGQDAKPKKTAPIDLAALGEQIAATAEKAKENDPAELRKKLRELERQLAARPAETKTETIVEQVEVPVPVFDGAVEKLQDAVADLRGAAAQIGAAAEGIAKAVAAASQLTRPAPQAAPARAGVAQPDRARPHQGRDAGSKPAPRSDPVVDGDIVVVTSKPQQRILNALAALEAIGVREANKTQLALFAEASPKSSSYSNNLGFLNNQAGLIYYPRGGYVALTDAGRSIADAGAAPQTTAELHRFVYDLVGGAKARLLEVLIDAYPEALEKNELAERAGASPTSSSFSNNLGSLRSLGLIDYPHKGYVAALPLLFLDGSP